MNSPIGGVPLPCDESLPLHLLGHTRDRGRTHLLSTSELSDRHGSPENHHGEGRKARSAQSQSVVLGPQPAQKVDRRRVERISSLEVSMHHGYRLLTFHRKLSFYLAKLNILIERVNRSMTPWRTQSLTLSANVRETRSTQRTGEAKRSAAAPADPEVVDRPLRRRFSPSYKLRIVEEADRCTEPGEVGQVLRREGLYSSHLTTWRKAAHSGSLKALSKKRGRKPERNPLDEKVRKLERRNARLENELRKAHLIIDVQGKVAGLLGISLDDGTNS